MNKSRHFLKNSKRVESAQSQPSFVAGGMGKKARLRLLQVWAKATGRPGFNCFFFAILLLATHIEDEEFLKIIRSQPSTVETKEKKQQHPQPPVTQSKQCASFPSYYLNRRTEAEPEECGDVVVTGSPCVLSRTTGSSSQLAIA